MTPSARRESGARNLPSPTDVAIVARMIAPTRVALLAVLLVAACDSASTPATTQPGTETAPTEATPTPVAQFDARDEAAHQAGQEALRCYESCMFDDDGEDEACQDSCGLAE